MKKIRSLLVVVLLLLSVASIVEKGNSLDQPFLVYGYIKDSSGNAVPDGVTVTVTDNSKSTHINVVTENGTGYYQADLFNLQNCENGDTIEIYCSYSGEDNAKTFTLDVSQPSKNVTFSLVGKPVVSTNDASGISSSSAKLNGELSDLNDASCQVWFEYGKTTSYGHTTSKQTKYSPSTFSKSVSGLQPDTTYHFRAVAKNSRKTAYGSDKTFHTGLTAPQVTTNSAGNIGYASATLNGYLNKVGASSCNVWFVYDTTSHTDIDDYAHATPKAQKTSASSFSRTISGLSVNVTYHFRAVAQNGAGTAVGDDATFTTHAVLPSVKTLDAGNLTSNSATLKGDLEDMGGENQCQVWFEYGKTTSYGHSTANISAGTTGEFDASVSSLEPGETYHFRAVAKNSMGISYGTDKNFTTPAVKAKIETNSIEYAVILKANITTLGGDENCEAWFEYNEEGGNVTETPKREVNSTGMFEEVITNLKENTTYYYRAVINNSRGISYGTNLSFKMFSLPSSPTVETGTANASYPNATLHANLTSMGGSTFCYVWFEYWNGEKYSTPVEIINHTGVFNASIGNIDDGVTYQYRAIAVGANGMISYGEANNFSIPALQNHEPSVTPIAPENNSVVNVDVSLMANVYDEDGDTMNIAFYLNGDEIYSGTAGNGVVSVAPSLAHGSNYEWYVIVSDGKCTNTSVTYYFSTVEKTKVNFTHSIIFDNEVASFNDTSTGNIEQWMWNFGDGNTSYGRNVTHTYKKAGSYIVNLTVTDEYGNIEYAEKNVSVWQRGDANMDGHINAMDITKVERITSGAENEPAFPNPADVDGDNDIDEDDVTAVIDIILGFS